MNLSDKQMQIINTLLICESVPEAERHLDLDELIKKVPYVVSKQALQFSLRSLRLKGMIKRLDDMVVRRGRKRVVYSLTVAGVSVMTAKSGGLITKTAI